MCITADNPITPRRCMHHSLTSSIPVRNEAITVDKHCTGPAQWTRLSSRAPPPPASLIRAAVSPLAMKSRHNLPRSNSRSNETGLFISLPPLALTHRVACVEPLQRDVSRNVPGTIRRSRRYFSALLNTASLLRSLSTAPTTHFCTENIESGRLNVKVAERRPIFRDHLLHLTRYISSGLFASPRWLR